ncbi:DapH/DapD/GlmU-related protein [Persicobacter sp. CCB-QB2]|uniref:acyltransferase n=1 Tax=Persicobacter sp. CCB-QB2 TaxID=1561025 RepID=UPI0006A9996E|nr:acyltransferase [Persicobacter sp. CCB-QB2]
MWKRIIESLIRKRNPQFAFDPALTGDMLLGQLWEIGWGMIRGLGWNLVGLSAKGLLAGRGLRLSCRSNMKLGKWVKIGDYVHLSAMGKLSLTLGNGVGIGSFSRIILSTSMNQIGAYIHLEDNVSIGEFAYLGGGGGLTIGRGTIVGQYLSCHPENHHFENLDQEIRQQGVSRQGISIGRDCWIGAKVTITDGVTIGDHCVIAAGAVVTKSMPAYTVIGGVPARVIRSRQIKEIA